MSRTVVILHTNRLRDAYVRIGTLKVVRIAGHDPSQLLTCVATNSLQRDRTPSPMIRDKTRVRKRQQWQARPGKPIAFLNEVYESPCRGELGAKNHAVLMPDSGHMYIADRIRYKLKAEKLIG